MLLLLLLSLVFCSMASFQDSTEQRLEKVSQSTDFCPTTFDDCMTKTKNCSFHGSCAQYTIGQSKCFHCNCTLRYWTDDSGKRVRGFNAPVDWTGDACHLQKISVSFHILLWTSVGIMVTMVFVVGMMYSVGETHSASPVSSGHLKSD